MRLELLDAAPVEHVDLLVGDEHDLARVDRILAHQRVERALEHRPGAVGHHGAAVAAPAPAAVEQARSARLAMFVRQVADALQLAVDLDHGDDEPQVAGHRLVQGQDLEALLLDLDLDLVDQDVARRSPGAPAGVALLDRRERHAQALLDRGAQRQDLALEPVDLSSADAAIVALPAQPNRPVMYSSVCFFAGLEKICVVAPNSTMRPWKKKAGVVAHAGRLLHVVGHEDDRVALLELHHQILDLRRGHRVDGRAGLVHEQDLRLGGDGARDAQPLLLAAGQRVAGLVQLVLDLVPERRTLERVLDAVVSSDALIR